MTIDVHGHISPREALRRFPMPPSLGDVEGMIERKLEHGVRLTVVGSPVGAGAMVPVPGVDNYAQPADALHRLHDWFAECVRRYPDHLRAYVYVNPFGGAEHLAWAAETARSPEFVGFITNSSVRGHYLTGPEAADLFAMLAEQDLPVLVHAPASPAAGTGLTDLMLLEQLGRFCDVTIGVAAIVAAGWLDRHPNLRLIAAGAGGALALLPEKLDLAAAAPHWGAPRPGGEGAGRPAPARPSLPTLAKRPSQYLRQVWVDTASPSARALRLNLDTFGADRVLYGTDSPPLPIGAVAGPIAALAGSPLDPAQRQAVLETNAVSLFAPRLPAGSAPAAAPAAVPTATTATVPAQPRRIP
jgi:aminocarboxymuconate-semialdehyde decarboxylase